MHQERAGESLCWTQQLGRASWGPRECFNPRPAKCEDQEACFWSEGQPGWSEVTRCEGGEGGPDPAFLWAVVFRQDMQTPVCRPSRGHSHRVRVLGFSFQIHIWDRVARDVFAVAVTFP